MPKTQGIFDEIDNKADAVAKAKELREKEERETSARIREKVDKCEFYKRVNVIFHPGNCTNPKRSKAKDKTGNYRPCLVDSCPLFT
jgi:hypothetical protein